MDEWIELVGVDIIMSRVYTLVPREALHSLVKHSMVYVHIVIVMSISFGAF